MKTMKCALRVSLAMKTAMARSSAPESTTAEACRPTEPSRVRICAGGCSAQNPCPSDNYCNAGKCFPKQPLGATSLDDAFALLREALDG